MSPARRGPSTAVSAKRPTAVTRQAPRLTSLESTQVALLARLDFAGHVEHQPGEPDAPREQRHRVIGRLCAAELLGGDRAQRGARCERADIACTDVRRVDLVILAGQSV